MRNIYVRQTKGHIHRNWMSCDLRKLQTKEKYYVNTISLLFTGLIIVAVAFHVNSFQYMLAAEKNEYNTSGHLTDCNTNTTIKGPFVKEIYWYIHSGIHDVKINIPPEGDLLQIIS